MRSPRLTGDNFIERSRNAITHDVQGFLKVLKQALVDGELTFANISLTQDGANTLIGVISSGETLAVLNNIQASTLGEVSFEIVPDVSNPEEALAII